MNIIPIKAHRETMIRKITDWKQGTGDNPLDLDNKPEPLTHIKLFQDGERDDVYVWQVKTDTDPTAMVDAILREADAQSSGARAYGLVPTYKAKFYFARNVVPSAQLHVPTTPLDREDLIGATPSANDLRRPGADYVTVLAQSVRLTEIHALDAKEARAAAQGMMETFLNKVISRLDSVEKRCDSMLSEREGLLDHEADRKLKLADGALKLQIKGAIAQIGLTALPSLTAGGFRKLNNAMGIPPEPMDQRMVTLLAKFGNNKDKLVKFLRDELGMDEKQVNESLALYTEIKGREGIANLEKRATAAANGVQHRMPMARIEQMLTGAPPPKQLGGAPGAPGQDQDGFPFGKSGPFR